MVIVRVCVGMHVMTTQEKHGSKGRPVGFLGAVIVAVALGGLAHAQPRTTSGQGSGQTSSDPYYIVLCTDVSGSMNESDPLYRDKSGKLTTLRDDAQLTFLTLLGECPIESFVGACKFSDRITGGLPGGLPEAVPVDSALLTWRSIGSDWESLREQLSTRKSDAGGTRIETALSWAHRRISLARQKARTKGHGIIILLSDGDPDRASGELQGGVILDRARELASDDIRVYSIIVNKASYRPGRTVGRISDREAAAEQLMERVGSTTHGGTHRITATSGLLQIFLDIFRIVPTSPPILNATAFDVSRHHRTVVFIGPMSSSITLEPAAAGAGGPYSLPIQDGMDATSGIDRKVIPLTMWNIIILRRPADSERLDRYWSGTWRPAMSAGQAHYEGRIYLIPDFLLRLAVEPTLPSWTNERIRIAAHLSERPRELGEQVGAAPLRGEDLSLSFAIHRGQATSPLTVGADKWDPSQQAYHSVPFQLDAPGAYTVACECVDRVENRTISLGTFTTDLSVEPAPLSLVLHRASNGEVIFPRSGEPASRIQGGEEIYAELRRPEDLSIQNVDARLHLTNAAPAQSPFTADASGLLVTKTFALPKGDVRLTGQAQVRLTAADVNRQLNLPGDFLYDRGALELTCQFSDGRDALWVGEYHKQVLYVSVFPVFADSADTIAGMFPRELPQAVVTFLETADGNPLTLPARGVLGMLARDRQQNAMKLTATYVLELETPIPPCRRCEIDPGPILTGLNAPKRQYEVVDSAERRIFAYRVRQSGDEEGSHATAETLVANEPVAFQIERALNLGIEDIVFEFREQGAEDANAVRVSVPISGTAASAQVERSLQGELQRDTNYEVYIYASVRPEGTDQNVRLRLHGGSLRAVERYLELQQLVIGPGTGEDLSGHAMEMTQIPVQATFTGYRPENADHRRLIAEFKDSCRLVGMTDGDRQVDASASIQWMKAQPVTAASPGRSYRLEGYGRYTPDAMGWHRMEISGEIEVPSPDGKLRSVGTADCRLFAKGPRFKVKVQEITPRTEKLLFDSDRLVSGGKGIEPIRNSYATQVRISLDFAEAVSSAAGRPLKASVIVRHRSPSESHTESVFAKEVEFTGGRETAEFVVDDPPLERTGEYFLQLLTAESEDARVEFTTPVLLTIVDMNMPQEVVAPRGFLTAQVRQWPFSYQVPIPASWSFKPIDLRFEFQFAGMKDSWFEGVASPGAEEGQLIVRGPDYLPVCDGVVVGPMRFRLRYMGADRVNWESVSPIQIVKPWLDGVDLLWKGSREEHVSNDPNLRLKPPFALRIRPRFRAAAELQGWWSKKETSIWIARTAEHADGASYTSPEYLARLTQLAGSSGGNRDSPVRVFRPAGVAEEQSGIEVLSERARGRRFWGLPRLGGNDVYLIMASASYEEKPLQTDPAAAGASAPNRVITEWTPVRAVTVERPWDIPSMWWLVLGVTGVCMSAQVARKRWVPAPGRLGLNIHLRGDAVVRPARQNPTVADLEHETSWSDEMQMYAEYVSSRHPGWGRPRVRLATWLTVALSRLFRVRRRLWISVRPEVDRSATHVQTALICIWTGLGRTRGALWSSKGGSIDLPQAGGSAEMGLNLTYQVRGNEMTAPVTVCIRRA